MILLERMRIANSLEDLAVWNARLARGKMPSYCVHGKRAISDEKVAEILECLKSGRFHTFISLVRHVEVDQATVRNYQKKHGVEFKKAPISSRG